MRYLYVMLFLACSVAALAQCSSTSYGNSVTCVQAGAAGGGDVSLTSRVVNISPTAGHQLFATGYWCHSNAGHDCTQAGTETVTLTTTGGTCTWTSAPHSPYYLQETGAQWTGDFAAFCPSAGTGITQVTATFSSAVDYPTVSISEWTGLATSAPFFDSDAGLFSTAAGKTFSGSFSTPLNYTKDLLLAAITTINDYAVTFTTPASSQIVFAGGGFGGSIGGLTISGSGSQSMAGNWNSSSNDLWSGPIVAIRSAGGVLVTVPGQFPRVYSQNNDGDLLDWGFFGQ